MSDDGGGSGDARFPDDGDPSRTRLEKEILAACHGALLEDFHLIATEVDKLRGSRRIHYAEMAIRYNRIARRTQRLRRIIEILAYALVVGVPAIVLIGSLSAGVDVIAALASSVALLALLVGSHTPPRAYQESTSRQSAVLALSSVVSTGVLFGFYNHVESLPVIDLPVVRTVVLMTAVVSATGLVTVVLLHGMRDYCRRMSGYISRRRANEQIVCEGVQVVRLLLLIENAPPDPCACCKTLAREKLAKIDRLLSTGAVHTEFRLNSAERSKARKRDRALASDIRKWRAQVVIDGHEGRMEIQGELSRLVASILVDRTDQIDKDVARRRADRITPSRAAIRRAVTPAGTGILILALVLLYRWFGLPPDPVITTVAVSGLVIVVKAVLSVTGTSDALARRLTAVIASHRDVDEPPADRPAADDAIDPRPNGVDDRAGTDGSPDHGRAPHS